MECKVTGNLELDMFLPSMVCHFAPCYALVNCIDFSMIVQYMRKDATVNQRLRGKNEMSRSYSFVGPCPL